MLKRKKHTPKRKTKTKINNFRKAEIGSVQNGDIVVLRCPKFSADALSRTCEEAARLSQFLKRTGRWNVLVMVLDHTVEAGTFNTEEMRKLGWIRLDA